jgi:regulator of sirC expression with transglutaminase-like and TPR domain
MVGVVYQAVASRLGVLVEPISVPNQLLWRVVDQHQPGGLDRAVIVDPGRNGEILDIDELLTSGDEGWLVVARSQTWQRNVLDELRQLLMRRRELGGALIVLHRQCASDPNNPTAFRERGLLHRRLGAPLAAIEDLETYLSLAPHASDVQNISETIDRARDELHRAPRHRAN